MTNAICSHQIAIHLFLLASKVSISLFKKWQNVIQNHIQKCFIFISLPQYIILYYVKKGDGIIISNYMPY